MVADAKEPIGSMGNDTPLAVLSDRPQLLYSYFKQLFAQVTNPPLDAIREELVTSLITTIGSEGNLLEETSEQCRLLRLDQPVVTNAELQKIKQLDQPGLKSLTPRSERMMIVTPSSMALPLTHSLSTLLAVEENRQEATKAIEEGVTIIILSDRGVSEKDAAIPALLATGGVHHHLIREGTRTHCGLVVESGEPREVHHYALLTGYGAGAVNPYLAFATIRQLQREGYISEEFSDEKLDARYIKAINQGLLKVMSKMGISTQQSYRGAQIFEAIGLNQEFIDEYFSWTPSRISGIGLESVAEESFKRHDHAFPPKHVPEVLGLD
ncbi:Ferredoxin-dependent glutamate synthase 1 (Fd-GOGAT), partial [Durusdinium trenchii]